ncbi:MAG: phage tail tape measure protein [Adhaeribacter sp.]
MSTRTDKVQITVEVEGQQALNELGKLEMQQKDILKSMKGMKAETAEYIQKTKEINKVEQQYKNLQAELQRLAKEEPFNIQQYQKVQQKLAQVEEKFQRLGQEIKTTKRYNEEYLHSQEKLKTVNAQIDAHREKLGLAGLTLRQLRSLQRELNNEMANVTRNTPRWHELKEKIEAVNTTIDQQSTRAKGLSGVWQNLKGNLGKMGMMAGAMVAAQAAWQLISQYLPMVIDGNKDLADSFADIEKATNMASGEVEQFNDKLKQIDSRTSEKDLRAITVIGGQLGVANNELLGFVENVDKAVVALGDEFKGGAEEVAKEVGAIQKLFSKTKDLAAGDAINKIGSAINALGAAGAATGPVVADFTQRVGALGSMAPEIEQTLGLGAALQELGLTAEIAASGTTKVILTMGKEAENMAKFLDMPIAKFKEMLNNSPNDALLLLAERFKGASNTQIIQTLEKLKINTQESIKVVSLLANNTDMVREKQELANKAMAEGTSLTEEFNKKNDNLAGKLEKLQKVLMGAFVNSAVMKGIEKVVDGLTKLFDKSTAGEKLVKSLEAQNKQLDYLQGNFTGLLKGYEFLSEKTNKTQEEQQRLQEVMAEIAKTVPEAVIGWDSYGRIMGINTKIAQDFIKEQQAVKRMLNADAIKEYEKELSKTTQTIFGLTNQQIQGTKVIYEMNMSGGSRVVEQSAKDKAKIAADLAIQQDKAIALRAEIARLKGEKTEAEKALENNPPSSGSGTGSGTGSGDTNLETDKEADKAKAAAEKLRKQQEADRLKELAELKAYQEAYIDAHNQAIQDQFDQERAIVFTNYRRKLEDVKGSEQQINDIKTLYGTKVNQELEAIEKRRTAFEEEQAQKRREIANRHQRAGALLEIIHAEMQVDYGPTDTKSQQLAMAQLQDKKIGLIQVERDIALQNTKLTEAERYEIIWQAEQDIAALRADFRQLEQDANVELAQKIADYMLQALDVFSSLMAAASEREQQKIERDKNSRLDALNDEFSKGKMRKSRYEKEKADIEKNADESIRQAKNDQAKKEKKVKIAEATIQGTLATIAASANPLGIFSPTAIATAIAAALSVAKIIATPIPEYKEGGLTGVLGTMPTAVKSKSVATGGMQKSGPFLATMNERGAEYVVPNYLLQQPQVADYVSIIESMRSGHHYPAYAEGGYTAPVKAGKAPAGTSPAGSSGTVGLEADILQALNRLNYNLENPKPAYGIWDFDYFETSTNEIYQVRNNAIPK